MKNKMIICLVGFLAACSIKHTPTDFRKKFSRSAKKPLIVEESFSKVYDGILDGSKKCFDGQKHTTRSAGGINNPKLLIERTYSVLAEPVKNKTGTIQIKYFWYGEGATKSTADTFMAIIDIRSVGDKKTEVVSFLRKHYVGDAIKIWATGKDRPCPDLGG